ncbi:MAG TPA: transporter [Acidobacteriota bacterium]|nr:transporter [Acidobacteriota bacterium]
MKRATLLIFVTGLCGAGLLGQQRPLVTEPANTVEEGHLLFDVGFEFYQDAVFPFSGLEGDLSRLGVLGFRLGVSEDVELQLLGTLQNSLNVDRKFVGPNTPNLNFNDDDTSSVGDFTLAAKWRFMDEDLGRPALAFRFGFKLPNASNESGLGTDETDIFGSFLFEKTVGKLRVIGNAGLIILGDPTDNSSQDDQFLYGFALLHPVGTNVNLLADFHGRAGDSGFGTEETSSLRLGAQVKTGGIYWDFGAHFGFEDADPDTGFFIGISKDFELWSP